MELMVVVVIIGVLTVLAVPSMLGGQNEKRAFQAAADVSAILREGRARAMGRGMAIAATLDSTGSEMHVVLYEDPLSVTVAGTTFEQVGGCKGTDWTTATEVGRVDIAGGIYTQIGVKSRILIGGVQKTKAVVCFAPSGRTFMGEQVTSPNDLYKYSGMIDVMEIEVARKPGGTQAGVARSVVFTPSGATRIVSR
jgi:Tfp pilus assembly protein FimT